MAQDLSQTIQDGLAQTLTDLLGIDARFQETTKLDRRDIQGTQLLEVKSEFEFDKLSSILDFLIPASSACIIFNTMMGATDYDISDTIDDDTTDAMGEFVSNVSGSLVTAFNAKSIEELGTSKFHIQHKELVEDSAIEDIENIFRFVIELNEKPIILFIRFDEKLLPFLEEIIQSAPTEYPEEALPSPQEEPLEEASTEESEGIVETEVIQTENNSSEQSQDNVIDEETEESEDLEQTNKDKKIKLMIIALSSVIALILIIFLILYLISPDDEEMEQENTQTEQVQKEETNSPKEIQESSSIEVTTKKTLKKVNFVMSDIDIARLNGRLATLTKYEILTKEELEEQKKEEIKRLERLQKEEELEEFAKLNKEEPIKLPPKPKKEEIKVTKKPQLKPEAKEVEKKQKPVEIKEEMKPTPMPVQEKEIAKVEEKAPITLIEEIPQEIKKLLFVSTSNIKYRLYKSLVSDSNSSSARISMCNDTNGRTTILIGPFENKELVDTMDQAIKNSKENIETTIEELTQEEFSQRCNF